MRQANAARKNKAQRQQALVKAMRKPEPVVETVFEPEANIPSPVVEAAIAEAIEQHKEDEKLRGKSVVPLGYKTAYARRAAEQGRLTKAAKRANGDWLARELEAECIEMGKFNMFRFLEICKANGIANPMERWPNRNNGWEGRLRMSAAIVLRGIVRKAGFLVTPEGAKIEASAEFLAA